MKNWYLFPRKFKLVGEIISVIFIISGILLLFKSDVFGVELYTLVGGYFATTVIVGLTIGLLMTAFAREKVEDECIANIRSRSLVLAVIINYLIVIIGSCLLYDLNYLTFLSINLFTLLIIYIIIFRLELYIFFKSNRNEE